MVFKRRDRRPIWKIVADFLWPRGGWARAFEYVKHRVRRLPDTPEKISRGVWAGVFTSFTPLFGFHFLVAIGVARMMRGNMLSSVMATFFGNPLTIGPIAAVSLGMGHWVLGDKPKDPVAGLGDKFAGAAGDLWHNFMAIFTHARADWSQLSVFYHEVFFPYLVGGMIPGVIAATIAYYISLPLISAYQNRRRKTLRAKLDQLKNKSKHRDGSSGPLG